MKIAKALRPAKILLYLLPEGKAECWLRGLGFRLSSNLGFNSPVNPGDVVVQAGCYRIETVEVWSDKGMDCQIQGCRLG